MADGPGLTAWLLTDGKTGDLAQCLGLAEALGVAAETRLVRPRVPYAALSPWAPADPADPVLAGRPPDLAIASGRRAIPYLRALKRLSGGRTFRVCLKDPRIGLGAAELIWVPTHDGLRGPNVLATLTGPHRVSAARLAAARAAPDVRVASLPRPRVAVLVGGDSRHHRWTHADVGRLAEGLRGLASDGASLAATLSRRTPERLRAAVRDAVGPRGFVYDGGPDNPYLTLLALADAIVVTADSVNMVGEAAAAGAPVLVFEPSGGHRKIDALLSGLRAYGAVRPFTGRLEAFAYEPLDCTPLIAEAVRGGLARHRSGPAARHPADVPGRLGGFPSP